MHEIYTPEIRPKIDITPRMQEGLGHIALHETQRRSIIPRRLLLGIGGLALRKLFVPKHDTPNTLNDNETTDPFETQNFVRQAPLLKDIANDETRTNQFTYAVGSEMVRGKSGSSLDSFEETTMVEHEGLSSLYDFLSKASLDNELPEEETSKAKDILEHTSFIGEKELDEATKGYAEHWKAFLQANPRNQLAVPEGMIRTGEYEKKSSEYIFDKIMSHFDENELKLYSKQIITDLDKLKKDASLTKIVMLDDWSISGRQMKNGIVWTAEHPKMSAAHLDRMELNLIAASQQQLDGGAFTVQGRTLPTLAYYKTNGSRHGYDEGRPFVTGTHSSVDFEFEHPIADIVSTYNKARSDDDKMQMPPMTNISRPYRDEYL